MHTHGSSACCWVGGHLGSVNCISMVAACRQLKLGLVALLVSAADAAQQDCSVALWWGGLDNAAKNDCDGDPRLEDINCVEGLNTLLKAVPTSTLGTVTQVITGQDPAQLAFKTATGKDVPAFCDDVCTQGCYSGFWFHSPCILDAGKVAALQMPVLW